MRWWTVGLVVVADCFLAPLAFGAEPTPKVPAPGHSQHGETFDEGPRQQAHLISGTGAVRFPVTTKSEAARQFIVQGVGQLHGFWYFEAERSFRQAAKLDPDCAIAYWGMAHANIENEKRAKGFIEKGIAKRAHAGRREQLYLDGTAAYFKTGKTTTTSERQAYIRSLETLLEEFPNDVEAKAFLACFLWQSKRKGLPIVSHLAVNALLDQVFAVEPMHPAHHYRIHLWDEEKPARALSAAGLCGPSAPGIAHMWHMPGHTYARLKRYDDSVWQMCASLRVDHAHMREDHIEPYRIHNYAHNGEWVATNLSNLGRVREAVAIARNLIEIPRHPTLNRLDKPDSCAGYGRTRLLDILARHELWTEVLQADSDGLLDETDDSTLNVQRRLAIGRARLRGGDAEQGIAMITQLREQQENLKASKDKKGQPNASTLEAAIAELEGWRLVSEGKYQEAATALAKRSSVPKPQLATVYAAAGDFTKAIATANEAVEKGVNEVEPLAAQVEVLALAGKIDDARKSMDRLRGVAGNADRDLPRLRRLSRWAALWGLPSDWRTPAPPARDLGPRPNPDVLGSLHWKPFEASGLVLDSFDGKRVSLADYRGRPVVVLFYLGFGCPHCVEQLQKFAPAAPKFQREGISLFAVSTESRTDLRSREAKGSVALPFPLAADPSLEVFRSYRAYDDFEATPLHGLFLIDGKGRVRWHEVGPEPFMDAEFLLRESKRLLTLPEA